MQSLMGVQGYGLIMTLIIGGLAGWIAEKLTKSNHGVLTNIIVGVLGAFAARWAARLLDVALPFGGFIGNLIVATVGAVVLITLYRMIKQRR